MTFASARLRPSQIFSCPGFESRYDLMEKFLQIFGCIRPAKARSSRSGCFEQDAIGNGRSHGYSKVFEMVVSHRPSGTAISNSDHFRRSHNTSVESRGCVCRYDSCMQRLPLFCGESSQQKPHRYTRATRLQSDAAVASAKRH